MKIFIQTMMMLTAMIFSFTVSAEGSWYVGPVSRVALIGDASFIVTLKTTALSDCMHNYAYFQSGKLDAGVLKNAYAIALTSATTGLDMGIVIDKAVNGSGGLCYAGGMAADLRAR